MTNALAYFVAIGINDWRREKLNIIVYSVFSSLLHPNKTGKLSRVSRNLDMSFALQHIGTKMTKEQLFEQFSVKIDKN
jgi:hypothetical protein